MIRLILLMAVVALGADALLNNGAYTQAAWRELSSHAVKVDGSGLDAKVGIEKREDAKVGIEKREDAKVGIEKRE